MLALLISFLALAGMPRWTTIPLLLLTTLLWTLTSWRAASLGFNRPVLDWPLAAVAAAIAAQLVPLPAGIVNALSPHAISLSQALTLDATLTAPPGFRPITLDARATLVALATAISVILTFVAARTVLTQGGVRTLCRVLVVGGAGLAAVSILLRAIWPERLMGLWSPDAISARPLGPFVNRNHFAGWVLLLLPLGTGYYAAQVTTRVTEARAQPLLRVLLNSRATLTAVSLAVLAVVLLLTLSRSAWLGLTAAAVVLWALGRQRPEGRRARWMTSAVAGIAFLITVLLFADIGGVIVRLASIFGDGTSSRSLIWRETMPIVQHFWLTGSGAGTFGAVMTSYQRTWLYFPHLGEYMHFNQAHNHYLQVAAEGGLLLGVPAAAAVAAISREIWTALGDERGAIFWVRAGAAASLAGIAAQSIVEIPLIAPANALLAAVVLAIAVHRRQRTPPATRV